MRHARCFRRVDAVKVDADVKRTIKHRYLVRRETEHPDDFDAEAVGLLSAMAGQRAYPHLHQPRRQPALHDPCEWRGVAARIAFEIIVEIGMGVEMQDRHRPVRHRYRLDQWKTHRMVAAERDWHSARCDHFRYMVADQAVVGRGVFAQRQIAVVDQIDIAADLQPRFARKIAALAPQRFADRRRPCRSAALERGIDIGWQTEQVNGREHGIGFTLQPSTFNSSLRHGEAWDRHNGKGADCSAPGPTIDAGL